MSAEVGATREASNINWTRIICLLAGLILFFVVYYSPPWPDAVDPMGKHFALVPTGEGGPGALPAGRHLVGL